MAQADPVQFENVIALAVVILPFLTTEALDRVDGMADDGWEGYVKVAIVFALFLAFFITILVVSLVFSLAGQAGGGVRLTAIYFLFAALYLPTLGLLIPPMVEATDLVFDSDLNRWLLVGVLLAVGIIAAFLINANPAT